MQPQRNIHLDKLSPQLQNSLRTVAETIKRTYPSAPTYELIFNQFDYYERRIIRAWEWPFILPKVKLDQINFITEENKATAFLNLQYADVELSFLINNLEQASLLPHLPPHVFPAQSMYISKPVKPQIEQILQQLATHSQIQVFENGNGFVHLFRDADEVDHNRLENGLRQIQISITEPQVLLEITNYFKLDIAARGFTKIQFTQGMMPWVEKTRGANQPKLNNQLSFGPMGQQIQTQKIPLYQILNINPQVCDYDQNCTLAAFTKGLEAPYGFKSVLDETYVDEIIKGCQIGGHLVRNHFERFTDSQGVLTLSCFQKAVNSLHPSWPAVRTDELFSGLDNAINGKAQGSITSLDLDTHVHFSAKKTLQQLHNQILIAIEDRMEKGNDMKAQFQKFCSQRSTCSLQDFRDVLNIMGIKMAAHDEQFVSRKYLVDAQQINYSEFVDDVYNAFRLKGMMVQVTKAQEDSVLLADAITKACYLRGSIFQDWLNINFGNNALSEKDFIQGVGKKLELVPGVCSELTLAEIYHKIDVTSKHNAVEKRQIVIYFQNRSSKNKDELMKEILKKLGEQPSIKQLIEPLMSQTQNKNEKADEQFRKVLRDELYLNKLDTEFVIKKFSHNNRVDYQSFLAECNIQQVQIAAPKRQMDQSEQDLLEKFKRSLNTLDKQKQFVMNLKAEDPTNTNFISFSAIETCVNKTVGGTGGYTKDNVKRMTAVLDTNNLGDFNYPQFVMLLLGQDLAQKLITEAKMQKKPKGKQLTQAELKACQDLIVKIRKDVIGQNKDVQQVLAKERAPGQKTCTPAEFKKYLGRTLTAGLFKTITNDMLKPQVYYLVREKLGEVSYAKLSEALALSDFELPLKQEFANVDETVYNQQLNKELDNKANIGVEVIQLQQFIVKSQTTLDRLLGIQRAEISIPMLKQDFENRLANSNYHPKDINALCEEIKDKKSKGKVSLEILSKKLQSLTRPQQMNQAQVAQQYGNIEKAIQSKIQLISDYLGRQGITTEQFHDQIDANKDGYVDQQEFVGGVMKVVQSASITKEDLKKMFEAIDINQDGQLSVNEFALHIKGAKLKREDIVSRMDPTVVAEVREEIEQLFNYFDNGQGSITAAEIFTTMKSIQPISIEKAQEMVKSVDTRGDGKISKEQFVKMMEPRVLDEFMNEENELEELRNLFKDADTDYSGFLTVDEFYVALVKMGVGLSRQEIIDLFSEFDVSRDRQLDIDEFIAILSKGNNVHYSTQQNKDNYVKMRKKWKLDKLSFLKVFKTLPQSFVPSFYEQRWTKQNKNLPSSVFRIQIDPRTLLWKDIMPIFQQNLKKEQQSNQDERPRLMPCESSLGAQIFLDEASGLLVPEKDLDLKNIVKREVRIGLYEKVKQEFICNCAHVVAYPNKKPDSWNFKAASESVNLNPVVFRTTTQDDLNREQVILVFELVLHQKTESGLKVLSCGYAETPLTTIEKESAKLKLPILGGSPLSQLVLDQGKAKKGGLAGIFGGNKETGPVLTVTFKALKRLEDENQNHLTMMPSTCFVHKKMLPLICGFRNYAATKLLPQTQVGMLKKPDGNVILSTFPKILDCPDVLETVAQVWFEDVTTGMQAAQKKNLTFLIAKMEEYVTRLFPIFSAVNFDYRPSTATQSACGAPSLYAQRQELIKSSLRFGNDAIKKNKAKAPETLDSFKPFNVRELEFEVWDDTEAKMNQILRNFEQTGLVDNNQNQQRQNQIPGSIQVPKVK